jgi:hypothetical protein
MEADCGLEWGWYSTTSCINVGFEPQALGHGGAMWYLARAAFPTAIIAPSAPALRVAAMEIFLHELVCQYCFCP